MGRGCFQTNRIKFQLSIVFVFALVYFRFVSKLNKSILKRVETQPSLINSIVDYYFEHHGKGQPSENAYVSNQTGLSQSSKTIVDLLCLIPDDLTNVNQLNEKYYGFDSEEFRYKTLER